MKIDLENRQTLARIDRPAVESLVGAFLLRPGPPATAFARVTVVLAADAEMRTLKRLHFGEDAVTDVISLAYTSLPGEEAAGGAADVFVNVEQALRVTRGLRGRGRGRAGRPPWSAASELALYLAHGIDHLRGGEDATPRGRAAMRRRDLRWVRWAGERGWVETLVSPRPARPRRRPRPHGTPTSPHAPH